MKNTWETYHHCRTPVWKTLQHWKPRVVMMPTLSSLVASVVVIMTTCGATIDNEVGIMTTQFSASDVIRMYKISGNTNFCSWILQFKNYKNIKTPHCVFSWFVTNESYTCLSGLFHGTTLSKPIIMNVLEHYKWTIYSGKEIVWLLFELLCWWGQNILGKKNTVKPQI